MQPIQAKTLCRRIVCLVPQDDDLAWHRFIQQLPRDWPLYNFEKYEMLNPRDLDLPNHWLGTPSDWAEYLTHFRLLSSCLDQGFESLLLVDYRTRFVFDFTAKLLQFLSATPTDWEMLYLGGRHCESGAHPPATVNSLVVSPEVVHGRLTYAMRGSLFIKKVVGYMQARLDAGVPKPLDLLYSSICLRHEDSIYSPSEWLVEAE